MSVSTGFYLNSIEVPSSTVSDMDRYFHNICESYHQSKKEVCIVCGEFRLWLCGELSYCVVMKFIPSWWKQKVKLDP